MTQPSHYDDALSTSSFDDPVPPGSEDSVMMDVEEATKLRKAHMIAAEVRRTMQQLPGVIVDSLAVRELADGGVLLEGRIQATDRAPKNFADSVKEATGVCRVIDRLRVSRTSALDETSFDGSATTPRKG